MLSKVRGVAAYDQGRDGALAVGVDAVDVGEPDGLAVGVRGGGRPVRAAHRSPLRARAISATSETSAVSPKAEPISV